MVFASLDEIKSLAAKSLIVHPTTAADITTTVYNDALSRGDAAVIRETGISTWSAADAVWGSIQEAAEYFGAAFVLERYPSTQKDLDKANMWYKKALDICASVLASTSQGIIIRAKPYKSYPLNPNASIYRSLPAGTGDVDDSTLEG